MTARLQQALAGALFGALVVAAWAGLSVQIELAGLRSDVKGLEGRVGLLEGDIRRLQGSARRREELGKLNGREASERAAEVPPAATLAPKGG